MDEQTRMPLDSTLIFFETIRPLATSTPYERSVFLPPLSSTPKSTRQTTISSVRRKFPVIISRRRLQFSNHLKNETKRTTMIWLL